VPIRAALQAYSDAAAVPPAAVQQAIRGAA